MLPVAGANAAARRIADARDCFVPLIAIPHDCRAAMALSCLHGRDLQLLVELAWCRR
jgi:hypothetical protein